MISFVLWVVLIVIAVLLLAYAILVESPIPYSEVVALVISTIITWTVTILYASGNVVTEKVSVVNQTVVDNITVYEYDLLQYPVINSTVTALLIVFAIGLSLYCMYILIPTVVELVNGGNA